MPRHGAPRAGWGGAAPTVAYDRAVNLGGGELIIILAIVLLLFGSTQLPKLARSLGQAQREFKKGTDEDDPDDTA